jgi:ankyrin repeat protein
MKQTRKAVFPAAGRVVDHPSRRFKIPRGLRPASIALASLLGITTATHPASFFHVKTNGTGGKPIQSEADPGLSNCWNSINTAFAAVKSRSTPGPWIIQVDDDATYDESVILSDFQTSATETLTLTKALWLSGRPTIYPRQIFRRALAINGLWPGIKDVLPDQPGQTSRRVTYVTVRGFTFKNNASGTDKTTEECVFSDNQMYLTEGQHIIEDCVFAGENQVYDSRNPILIAGTSISTVFRRNIVQGFIMNDTNKVSQFARGHGGVFVMAEPVTNVVSRPQVTIADNQLCGNQGVVAIFVGDTNNQRQYPLVFERNKVMRNTSVRYPIMIIERNALSNIVRNNLFADNTGVGKTLALFNASDTKIYHNTFFNNHMTELDLLGGSIAGVEIKNNIFWPTPGSLCFSIARGCTGNPIWVNNAFYTDYNDHGYPPGFGLSTNENTEIVGHSAQRFGGKEMRVDLLNGASTNSIGNGYTLEGPGLNSDLHLLADSLCIDRGVSGLVKDDVDGKSRPVGAGYDIGACEYNSTRAIVSPKGKQETRLTGQQAPQEPPLHFAAYRGDRMKVEVLIREGVNVDQLDGRGYAPLHYAARNRQKAVMELLMAKGANVDIKSSHGQTPLFNAIAAGPRDVAELLISMGADIGVKSFDGETPLFNAVAGGHKDLAELLISKGADVNVKDKNGQTVLHKAVRKDQKDLAELLISHNADLNAKDKVGGTPLSRLFVFDAIYKQDPDLLQLLVNNGADVNYMPDDNPPPLYYAIWDNNQDLVRFLLSKGADVNNTPKGEYPPLHYAVWEKNISIVKILMEHGARFDAQDRDSSTAFREAASQGSKAILQLFVAKGADASTLPIAACMGDMERVKALVAHGADINAPDELGWTPLYWAVATAQTEVAEFLIAQGADAQARTKKASTPLHRAASAGKEVSVNGVKIAELLISEGADVNAKDEAGNTPLHNAVRAGHKATVQLLIERGADVEIQDNKGFTALKLAEQTRNRVEIADILRQRVPNN